MTTLTEGRHPGEAILSEANGQRSREAITIESGENLAPNTVLGRVTASGNYVAYDETNSDGSETAAAVLFDAVDATGGDAAGVAFVRDAEVFSGALVWKGGVDETGGITDLAGRGIIVRD